MGYKLVVRGRSSSSLLGCLSLIGLLLLLRAVAIAAVVPICFIVLVDELLLALESHVGKDVETAELLLHIWPDLEQGIPLLFVLVGNDDVWHRSTESLAELLHTLKQSSEALCSLLSNQGKGHVRDSVDIGHRRHHHQWEVQGVGAISVVAAEAIAEALPYLLRLWEGEDDTLKDVLLSDGLVVDAFFVKCLDDGGRREVAVALGALELCSVVLDVALCKTGLRELGL